jgi:hypothetical protein
MLTKPPPEGVVAGVLPKPLTNDGLPPPKAVGGVGRLPPLKAVGGPGLGLVALPPPKFDKNPPPEAGVGAGAGALKKNGEGSGAGAGAANFNLH